MVRGVTDSNMKRCVSVTIKSQSFVFGRARVSGVPFFLPRRYLLARPPVRLVLVSLFHRTHPPRPGLKNQVLSAPRNSLWATSAF